MSKLLKDIYSESFYMKFTETVCQSIPSFDKEQFISFIFNIEFSSYELKARMTHTANVLQNFLSEDFHEATLQIQEIINNLKKSEQKDLSLEFMFFPEYIARYGLDQFDRSIEAMEFITQFTSCEFAVRPFILKYEQKMLNQMQYWSVHENHKVRRLASEGSRPRLPWAVALPLLKQNPEPILPILENLKRDRSEYVRRSVANNLNDISKDNPAVVKEIGGEWLGNSKETDAIIKHGCRTLLKQADADVMRLFGLSSEQLEYTDFIIHTPDVKRGEVLKFSFSVGNHDKIRRTVRLEYALYYRKKNGTLSKKVYKISEREIDSGQFYSINRKQSFRPITTRTYYPGEHKLSVIINGKESAVKPFELF